MNFFLSFPSFLSEKEREKERKKEREGGREGEMKLILQTDYILTLNEDIMIE